MGRLGDREAGRQGATTAATAQSATPVGRWRTLSESTHNLGGPRARRHEETPRLYPQVYQCLIDVALVLSTPTTTPRS